MKSQLTEMANELASRRGRGRVLNYADTAANQEARAHTRESARTPARVWRRVGLSAGLGIILFGLGMGLRGAPEVLFCLAAGGILFGASIPSVRQDESEEG